MIFQCDDRNIYAVEITLLSVLINAKFRISSFMLRKVIEIILSMKRIDEDGDLVPVLVYYNVASIEMIDPNTLPTWRM